MKVFEIRSRFLVRNMLIHDPRSSHAKTTPIGASKPLWVANTTRTDAFDSLAQQVFCLVIREDESNWSIKTTTGPKYNANRSGFDATSESNTPVCVVFANRSGFDAAIVVVMAWEERG
ncbi:uncharacterized protein G2W53_041675 [Senna tora]|uniref:Uncharacterized protein n=1 Tax=Senna tora TaxID=362788 RepID=A0A834W341_9FABA|nr:uncharacterized protein G2W53_041675 [Senna tora]